MHLDNIHYYYGVVVSECAECGAPMVQMKVRGGGMMQKCTRKGCKEHMLDLNGIN